jgi:pimeloyl-ACP methyl ester carboxylesterase
LKLSRTRQTAKTLLANVKNHPHLTVWISHGQALCAALLLALSPVLAADELLRLPTRPEINVPVFYMPRPDASATIILLPGGAGSFGALVDGQPTGRNFLVRERERFAAAGFNVAIVGRPTDIPDLDTGIRTGEAHLADLRAIVSALKAKDGLPIWLVGTSRGTVSATAAAIAFGEELAGIVLTSSILAYKLPGAVPRQDLAAIRIPVLMVHHADDACWACRAYEAPAVIKALKQAPARQLQLISGGGPVSGDACEPFHHHGFIGIEEEVIQRITSWIRHPRHD